MSHSPNRQFAYHTDLGYQPPAVKNYLWLALGFSAFALSMAVASDA